MIDNEFENLKLKNEKLSEEIKVLKTKLEYAERTKEDTLAYYRESQMMLEVNSRLNNQSENNDLNINLALTTLTGYLAADRTIIYEKDENGNYHARNTSLKYSKKQDEELEKLFKNFTPSDELSGIIQMLEDDNVTEIDNLTIALPDGHQTTISRMAFAPISINKEVRYILCVFNHKREKHFLKYVTPFFGDALDRIEKNKIIRQMSITDKFTGLYDRDYYTEVCQDLEHEYLDSLGVIEVDVNRLKYINDTFGHDVGDTYIKSIASIIKDVFGEDMAFRIGGDEFVVICKNKSKEYIELGINTVQENIKNLTIRFANGVINDLSASIGMSYATEHIDINRLYKEADQNMYKEKQEFYSVANMEK